MNAPNRPNLPNRPNFPERVVLMGAGVDAITPAAMLERAAVWAAARRRSIVANHNAHSLSLVRRTPAMQAIYDRADLIEIDSVPLIFWGRLLGEKVSRNHRCNYLDFRGAFWSMAAGRRFRVFHLGCRPGVGEAAREAIVARHPGVTLDVRDGFFDPQGPENAAVLDQIAAFDPHILLVGMGMPRQELWIMDNLERLPGCVIFPIGAAFDYEAGVIATPPRWAARLGLEWLARLIDEPGRLAHRYLIEPWSLLPLAAGDVAARLGRVRRRFAPASNPDDKAQASLRKDTRFAICSPPVIEIVKPAESPPPGGEQPATGL